MGELMIMTRKDTARRWSIRGDLFDVLSNGWDRESMGTGEDEHALCFRRCLMTCGLFVPGRQRSWRKNQKWVCMLLVSTIFFNNPLFAAEVSVAPAESLPSVAPPPGVVARQVLTQPCFGAEIGPLAIDGNVCRSRK